MESSDSLVEKLKRIPEQTHAGVALLLAALLDEGLKSALLTKMPGLNSAMRKKLFKGYGPLSTFSARIDVAYALQIISKETRDDLDVIRSIRNKFAHPAKRLSFESAVIRELFKTFEGFDGTVKDYQMYYLDKGREIAGRLPP